MHCPKCGEDEFIWAQVELGFAPYFKCRMCGYKEFAYEIISRQQDRIKYLEELITSQCECDNAKIVKDQQAEIDQLKQENEILKHRPVRCAVCGHDIDIHGECSLCKEIDQLRAQAAIAEERLKECEKALTFCRSRLIDSITNDASAKVDFDACEMGRQYFQKWSGK